MKIFLYSLLLLVLNILLGRYLSTYETVDLKQLDAFFPASRWDDYYVLKDSIDVLFLGSSHAYRSYDPKIISEKLGGEPTVFNFGSSGQTPLTSSLILEEVLQHHRPEAVVMDVFVMVFDQDPQAVNTRINWSAMQPGEGRQRFFQQGFNWKQKTIISLFPSYLHRAYLKRKVQVLLGMRHTKRREEIYQGNGFVTTPDTISVEALRAINAVTMPTENLDFITAESIQSLTKIMERCAQEGIPLLMMVSPIPGITSEHLGIFDESYEYFDSWSTKWEVPYHDFIYQRLPTIQDGEHFYDDHHMNAAGAALYSEKVAEILKPYVR